MRNIQAIMQRELLSLFCSPIAFIVISGFLFFAGLTVVGTDGFSPGQPASLRDALFWTTWVLAIILPAITMRLLSEEYRTGTIESLMTASLSDMQLVLGKYLAAMVFYIVMLIPTLLYPILMEVYGNPDWGILVSQYLGLLLTGALFVAFGLFASSLTRNQVVAWILGALPLLVFAFLVFFFVTRVQGFLRTVFQQVNVLGRLDELNRGLVTTDGVLFFVATTVLFLFLTVKVVESRRWR